ncbi:NADH-quinone oxidoreductase subunit C [Candidatus Clostridium stratigraminis]|uniref:NAD(P)H dehydrogenase subunit J n=1 Tax=Candidatus Clostridium stratigraminis TaxID=3381661 RepID=A0ABW8T333_9CLOT
MVDINNLLEELNKHFNGQLVLSENGQAIYVTRENIVDVLKLLKEELGFGRLADITSADYEDRFEVIYHLLNVKAELLAVKVKLQKDDMEIPTITPVWKAADPQEREIYDLMGITFKGHENLTRILCVDDFVGHPLQKSFKLDKVNRF